MESEDEGRRHSCRLALADRQTQKVAIQAAAQAGPKHPSGPPTGCRVLASAETDDGQIIMGSRSRLGTAKRERARAHPYHFHCQQPAAPLGDWAIPFRVALDRGGPGCSI